MSDQNFFLSKTLFREFERKHLRFIHSLEDLDLIWAIGYAQQSGHSVGLKELVHAEFGSPKTLQRRLDRLRDRGVIIHRQSSDDARRIEFFLADETIKCLEAYKTFILDNGMASRDPALARSGLREIDSEGRSDDTVTPPSRSRP